MMAGIQGGSGRDRMSDAADDAITTAPGIGVDAVHQEGIGLAKGHKERIAVIGDGATTAGFRLAGVRSTFVLSGAEAEAKLSELLSSPDYGIVMVPERLIENCDWRLKKRIEATAKPVVVAIPGIGGPIEQSESLPKLIKRALGVDLTKKK